MRPALFSLALLSTALLSPAQPAAKETTHDVAHKKCAKCSHAPCRCGYSPSYYTHFRKPVDRSDREPAPVRPHWSRPTNSNCVTPVRANTGPSPRVTHMVPTPQPVVRTGYVTRGSGWASRRTVPSACAVPSRSSSLVPTPRRPRAVPSVAPRTSLGYDPSRSWASGGFLRRPLR